MYESVFCNQLTDFPFVMLKVEMEIDASLEFSRRELVRQRDSVQLVGWASGHLLMLTLIVTAVFIGAEWSSRHPQEVAAVLKDAPPMARRVGPIVALIASWVAAMIAYLSVSQVESRTRTHARSADRIDDERRFIPVNIVAAVDRDDVCRGRDRTSQTVLRW